MRSLRSALALCAVATTFLHAQAQTKTGAAAFEDAVDEKPGNRVHITVNDLPAPNPAEGVSNNPKVIPRNGMEPVAPAGYRVQLMVPEGKFKTPRLMRTAPNGDIFLADPGAGKVYVMRGIGEDGKPAQIEEFATDVAQVFGINFYPAVNPQWVYVANVTTIVRFPYHAGDLHATGAPQTLVTGLPSGGHFTRDIVFSKDGQRMFVSVGSGSNVDDPDTHPREFHRADVLEYKPDGTFVKVYAAGIRNCVGEAINPATGQLWCSVNERDMLGNHLVPDYMTHVEEGGFYGWPYFYMGGPQGGKPDPRLNGAHPELQAKTLTPDLLMQPHMASLQMLFYPAGAGLPGVAGDIFAAEHGSWNRKDRAGYEVVHAPVRNGKATGEYEDFLTGFVTPQGGVWGRPVGITVAKDGSLIVSEDGNATLWRVTYTGGKQTAAK